MGQQCCVEDPAVDDGTLLKHDPASEMILQNAMVEQKPTVSGVVPEDAQKGPVDEAPAEAPKAAEAPAEPKAPEAPEQAVIDTDERPSMVEFVVSVEKTADATIGLSFDIMEEHSVQVVTRIVPESLIDAWNKANPDKAVQVDDALIGVNGASEQLIQKVGGTQGQLDLVFRRPKSLTLSFTKEDQVGARLTAGVGPGSEGIFVQSIKEGGAFAKSAADFGVKPGDRIVSVNGKREKSSAMLKSVQEAVSLELQVLSY